MVASLVLHHCRAWGHAKSLLKATDFAKHLVASLGVPVQLLPDRVHWLGERFDVRLEVALALHRRCRNLRRYRHCRGRPPVLPGLEDFLLQPLFLKLHLLGLLLAQQVLLHASSALAHIEMLHLVAFNSLICLRLECRILLLDPLLFCPLLQRLQSYQP